MQHLQLHCRYVPIVPCSLTIVCVCVQDCHILLLSSVSGCLFSSTVPSVTALPSHAEACWPRFILIGVKVHYELRIGFHFMHRPAFPVDVHLNDLTHHYVKIIALVKQLFSICNMGVSTVFALRMIHILSHFVYDHVSTSSCSPKSHVRRVMLNKHCSLSSGWISNQSLPQFIR